MHRVLYRRRLKQHLVRVASRLALAALALLLLSLVSAVLLIMDMDDHAPDGDQPAALR